MAKDILTSLRICQSLLEHCHHPCNTPAHLISSRHPPQWEDGAGLARVLSQVNANNPTLINTTISTPNMTMSDKPHTTDFQDDSIFSHLEQPFIVAVDLDSFGNLHV
jgi:hypothetical protein